MEELLIAEIPVADLRHSTQIRDRNQASLSDSAAASQLERSPAPLGTLASRRLLAVPEPLALGGTLMSAAVDSAAALATSGKTVV